MSYFVSEPTNFLKACKAYDTIARENPQYVICSRSSLLRGALLVY